MLSASPTALFTDSAAVILTRGGDSIEGYSKDRRLGCEVCSYPQSSFLPDISHVTSRAIYSTTGLAHPNPLYAVNVPGARLIQPCHPSRVEIDVAGLRPTRLAFY